MHNLLKTTVLVLSSRLRVDGERAKGIIGVPSHMTSKPGVSSLESTRLNDDAKSKIPNMPKIRSRKIADGESVDRVKCDLVLSARRRRIWKPSAFQGKGQCIGMTTAGKNLGNRTKQGWG